MFNVYTYAFKIKYNTGDIQKFLIYKEIQSIQLTSISDDLNIIKLFRNLQFLIISAISIALPYKYILHL